MIWSAIGLAAFVAVLALVRETAHAAALHLHAGRGRAWCCWPSRRCCPASLSEVNGAKVWISVGGFSIQPGEFAKLALAVFFAGYLVAKRDVLSPWRAGGCSASTCPAARDLGPGAHRAGSPACSSWSSRPTSAPPRCSSACSSSCCTSPPSGPRGCSSASRCSWPARYVASKLFSPRQRAGRRSGCTRSPATERAPQLGYQLVQGLYGMGYGGMLGTGLGHGQPYFTPLAPERLHLHRLRRGTRPDRPDGDPADLRLIVQRGLRAAVAVRDPFAKLLAGGLSFVLALQVFVIVGGVTGLIPLTGITTPVPVPGRLLAGRQLGADRPADADQRHRAAARAAADPGRGDDPGGAGERMNRALRRISLVCLAMFAAAAGQRQLRAGLRARPAWPSSTGNVADLQPAVPVPARRRSWPGRQDHRRVRSTSRASSELPAVLPGPHVTRRSPGTLGSSAPPGSRRPRTASSPAPTRSSRCTT